MAEKKLICPICGGCHKFEMLSICQDCGDALQDCPVCDSDDIEFDWSVSEKTDNPIDWYCQCNRCTLRFEGEPKMIYKQWQENKEIAKRIAFDLYAIGSNDIYLADDDNVVANALQRKFWKIRGAILCFAFDWWG